MTMKQSTPISGNPVNLASFAQPSAWSDGQGSELQTTWLTADEKSITRMLPTSKANTWQYGVEWLENQEIASVDLQFDHPLPEGTRIQVQYWRKTFPTLAPERVEGARRGWIGCDDPFHGEWITVRGSGCFNGNSYTFQFDRLYLAEVQESQGHTIEEAEDYLPQFRRTLKVRALVESTEQPGIISFQAFSLRKWEQREIAILFGVQKKTTGDWSGQASVYFGYLIDIKPLSFEPDDNLLGDSAWNCAVTTQPKGLSLTVLCIAEPGVSRAQTMVTINSASHSFTFQVSDLEHGPIYIPDYDVLIHTEGENADVETILKKVDTGIISIYDRINTEPEASLEGNTSDVPPLDVCKQEPYGRYLPLSLEDGRQEIAVRYNGEVFIEKNCLKLSGRDAARLLYPGHLYRIRFGSGDPPDFRENRHATTQSVEEGWLPIIHSSWLDREVQYNETVLVAPISG